MTKDDIFPLTPDSNLKSTKKADNKAIFVDNSEDTLATLPTDITEPIMNITVSDSSKDTKEVTSKVLSVTSVPQTDDGTFNGTQMNWCGAAVTAAIINYKNGTSLTAKSVTREALGSALNQGITNAQVVSVGTTHGLAPRTGNPLSYSSVKTEINGFRPVYMQMQRTENGVKKYHALGLIGYSSTKYTVINPWYQNSLTINKKDTGSDVTYITGTSTYK